MSAAVVELRTLGTVDEINLSAQDVTGAAQDLDARIAGLEISVTRMSDLLAKATTSADIIAAEGALSERQTNLEQLKSERARLSEQVALSTLNIALYGPELAPPPLGTAGPDSFFDGLVSGWNALVNVVQALVIVLGVLLPWLVIAALITWAVLVLVRRYRRTHPKPPRAPGQQPRVPVGAMRGPGPAGFPFPPAPGPAQPPSAPPLQTPDGP